MNKEELIQYIRENLTIHLDEHNEGGNTRIEVQLVLDDETISTDAIYVNTP